MPISAASQNLRHTPFHDIHAQVIRTAEEHGFVPVDMLPVYTNSGYDVPTIAADAEHPNSLGLDLAAAELERVIVARHQELLKLPAPSAGEVEPPDVPR